MVHSFAGEAVLPEKQASALDCCNDAAAAKGSQPFKGVAQDGPSGLPFTQLLLCKLGANSTDQLPFGAVGYFSPDVEKCPPGWRVYDEAKGRTIVATTSDDGKER